MLLKGLFNGDLRPAEMRVKGNPEYERLNKEFHDQRRELEKAFSPEQIKMIDGLLDTQLSMLSCEIEDKFEYGFVMGVRLMQEVDNFRDFREEICD